MQLRDLQLGFAAALRDPAQAGIASELVSDEVPATARLQVYRNNARAMFDGALARTYPVLRRRVGEAFFAQLAAAYRFAHPSRSGDLHWVGAAFPAWLEAHLADSEYAWLAELARLEWACEDALVATDTPPIGPELLGSVPAEHLDTVRFDVQPSLRCVSSAYPVWSVWRTNQAADEPAPVDLTLGAEHVLVFRLCDELTLRRVPGPECSFVALLAAGRTLGEALEDSRLDVADLAGVLQRVFADALVTGVRRG